MKNSSVRQNIIETASRLFYNQGYNLTGINEIIREASIAKATLYSHFKSKEDICLAYLKHKNDQLVADVKVFIAQAPKGKSQLLVLFDFLKVFFKSKDFNGCWCLNTISEIPKENERIRSEIQRQKQEFMTLIEDTAKQNYKEMPSKEAELLAKKIYLLYETAVAESHLHESSWPIGTAREMAKAILPA
ncbi:MAG: TetR/AcrR family transcriptional regulator [Saprospiraceae bacterium]